MLKKVSFMFSLQYQDLAQKVLRSITPEALTNMLDAKKIKELATAMAEHRQSFEQTATDIADNKVQQWQSHHTLCVNGMSRLSTLFAEHHSDETQNELVTDNIKTVAEQNKERVLDLLSKGYSSFALAHEMDEMGGMVPLVEAQEALVRNYTTENYTLPSFYAKQRSLLNAVKNGDERCFGEDQFVSDDMLRGVIKIFKEAGKHDLVEMINGPCNGTKRMINMTRAVNTYTNDCLMESMRNYGDIVQEANVKDLREELITEQGTIKKRFKELVENASFSTESAEAEAKALIQQLAEATSTVINQVTSAAEQKSPKGILLCVPNTL